MSCRGGCAALPPEFGCVVWSPIGSYSFERFARCRACTCGFGVQVPRARRWLGTFAPPTVVVLAFLLVLAAADNELLPTCGTVSPLGPQDSTPQNVLFVEIGGAEVNAPAPATAACSTAMQAAVGLLQSYLTSAGRGDVVTYLPLNERTVLPDLSSVDQLWVRRGAGEWEGTGVLARCRGR